MAVARDHGQGGGIGTHGNGLIQMVDHPFTFIHFICAHTPLTTLFLVYSHYTYITYVRGKRRLTHF